MSFGEASEILYVLYNLHLYTHTHTHHTLAYIHSYHDMCRFGGIYYISTELQNLLVPKTLQKPYIESPFKLLKIHT